MARSETLRTPQNLPARTVSWPNDPVQVRRPKGGIGPSDDNNDHYENENENNNNDHNNDDHDNDNNDHNNNDNENLRRAVETARPIFLLDRLKRRGYRDVRRGKVDPE